MSPEPLRARSGGFALMAALFIVVTLAAIGAYLLTLSTGQAAAASQDEQAARAYQAARAGIDWGAYQILVNSSCAASQTIPLQQGSLAGFWVKVDCSLIANETEGAVSESAYLVVATGCNRNACGPANTDAQYVERQLELTLTK